MGPNEVTSSVSIDAAMIQWNARAASEWRFTFAGTRAASCRIDRRGMSARRLRPERDVQRVGQHEHDAEPDRRVDEVPLRVRQDLFVPGIQTLFEQTSS